MKLIKLVTDEGIDFWVNPDKIVFVNQAYTMDSGVRTPVLGRSLILVDGGPSVAVADSVSDIVAKINGEDVDG